MRSLLGSRSRAAVLAAACLALVVASSVRPRAASPNVVISQIYGAGGNSNAVLANDYVELFNRSPEPVSLSGWSIQYASTTGTGNLGSGSSQLVVLPAVTLEAGHYYLIKLATGGTNGAPLPPSDATGSINMGAGGGKVALVNGTTSLGCNGGSTPCGAEQLAKIIDLVGWDGANFYETAAAPATSTSLAVFRANGGCTDTDNNAGDFTAAAPAPRNTGSPWHACPGWPLAMDPTVTGVASPTTVIAGKSVTFTATVVGGTVPPSTGLTVVSDLTAIGGDANQDFYDDGTHGDAVAGDLNFTYTTFVAAATAPGTMTLPLTVRDTQGRSGNGSIALTVEPPPAPAAIHDIQGSGSVSPLAGQRVETTGVVTGVKYNGFFIQAAATDYDGDPNTSEGVFVFTSSAPPSTAAVGNLVDVIGTVQEYPAAPYSLTEVASPLVAVLSTGNALPDAIAIDGLVTTTGGFEQLERYEGMRVSVASMTVVGPTGTRTVNKTQVVSDGQFYAVMTGTGRPFREPGLEPTAPPIDGMPANVPRFDGNPERLLVDSDALNGLAPLDVTSGTVITGITGPLDCNNGVYTIDPESTPTLSGGIVATPLAEAGAGQFTVASWNMLNFTADATRMAKASSVIRNVLRMPDIVGVQEMKDLATLQALASQVNSGGAPGSATYTAHLLATEVGQDVGFLVKSSVTDVEVIEMGRGLTFPHPVSGDAMTLNDRPPLVLHGTFADPRGGTFPITVIVNHLRSLIDVEADSATGQFARAKRRAGAEYLANLIAGYQANGEHVVSVGDYNAFQFNDGYVDVIGTILGNPTPADQVLLPSGDVVDPDFVDLIMQLPEADRYSYLEAGNAQALDHIIVSADMQARVAGVACARVNADFPKILSSDANRPERVSDHDPVVAYFTFPTADVSVTASAEPSDHVLSGSTVTYTVDVMNAGPDGAENVIVTDTLPAGLTVTSAEGPAGWSCKHTETTVTCNVAALTGSASLKIEAAVGDDLPTGNLQSALAVQAGTYDSDTSNNTFTLTTSVVDPPPTITGVQATPSTLWPVNHKLVPVAIDYAVADNSDPNPVCSLSVTSSEPTDGRGDGRTATDWQVLDAHHLLLRAERSGTGSGRTYTIGVSCSDARGHVSLPASATVFVPHDQRK